MRYFYLFIIVLSFSACLDTDNQEKRIIIDLRDSIAQIPYSLFTDSLSYITLKIDGDNMMSVVKKLYIDGDYILMQDYSLGLFIFSKKDGKLIKNIDYFGAGPEEFTTIRSFTFDPQKKQVIIYHYPFLKKYTYDGIFVESINAIENNTVELYYNNTGEYICVSSEEIASNQPCGVWLVDSAFHYIKNLKEIPKEQKLYTRSQFYNWTPQGIYFYDRVWEDFSFITKDSVEILYEFDFKQRVPAKLRDRENSIEDLEDYWMIRHVANSDRFLLLSYANFKEYLYPTWVLFDKLDNKVVCSRNLNNDISSARKADNLFYVDDRTWCRILEFEEENADITLEFIHLKGK